MLGYMNHGANDSSKKGVQNYIFKSTKKTQFHLDLILLYNLEIVPMAITFVNYMLSLFLSLSLTHTHTHLHI